MARPKKENKDRKTHQVNVHMTESEYWSISQKANDIGKPIAHFMKESALKQRIFKANFPPIMRRLLIELSRQGTNLNQIARKANSNVLVEQSLKEQLGRTLRILNSIKLILIDDSKAD